MTVHELSLIHALVFLAVDTLVLYLLLSGRIIA